MKTKLTAALLSCALVLLAARIVLRIAENRAEDAPVHEDYSALPSYPSAELKATWERDEARRIEWQSVDTFNVDGTWKYASSDPEGHFREQMRQLGWPARAKDCLASRR